MNIRVITPPAVEPVSLAEVKAHLRVDHSDEDDLISALIQASRELCEAFQNRTLITTVLELVCDGFPGSVISLPRPPLQGVTSITATDEAGVDTVVSAADYLVSTAGVLGRVVLKSGSSWPAVTLQEVDGFVVRYTAGYGDDPADVPQLTRQGILLTIGHLYENRETVVIDRGISVMEVPMTAQYLWWPDRVMGF